MGKRGSLPKPIEYKINNHGCWIETNHFRNKGYPITWVNGKGKYISRVFYEKFKGKIPIGMSVLHNCPGGDNPACINPDHLWTGTTSQNMLDRHKKGRTAFGHKLPHKLTDKEVVDIYNSEESKHSLSKKYKISRPVITAIKRKLIWKNLTLSLPLPAWAE